MKKTKKDVMSMLLKEKDCKDVIEAVKRAKTNSELAFVLIENECFDVYDKVFDKDDAVKYWVMWSSYGYIKLKKAFTERITELELHVGRLEQEIANMTKAETYLKPEKEEDYFSLKEPRCAFMD